jgi:hypothetical protein
MIFYTCLNDNKFLGLIYSKSSGTHIGSWNNFNIIDPLFEIKI